MLPEHKFQRMTFGMIVENIINFFGSPLSAGIRREGHFPLGLQPGCEPICFVGPDNVTRHSSFTFSMIVWNPIEFRQCLISRQPDFFEHKVKIV